MVIPGIVASIPYRTSGVVIGRINTDLPVQSAPIIGAENNIVMCSCSTNPKRMYVASTSDLTTWTPVISSSTASPAWNQTTYSLAYGNDIWVLTPINAPYTYFPWYTSTDGTTWTSRGALTTATTAPTSRTVFTKGMFLRPVRNKVFTSVNGINYTERSVGNGLTTSVVNTSGNDNIMIASSSYVNAISTDGVTWTNPPGTLYDATVRSTLWCDDVFIASTFGYSLNSGSGVYVSPDGTNWTLRGWNGIIPSTDPLTGFAYGNGVLMAATRNVCLASYDKGITWNIIPVGLESAVPVFTGLVFDGTKFITNVSQGTGSDPQFLTFAF